MIKRLCLAVSVLLGRKTAVALDVPGLIVQNYFLAQLARLTQPNATANIMPEPKTPEQQTEEHSTARSRLLAVRDYLVSLPALFLSVAAALEKARLDAQVGSEERAAYQAQIDDLTAKGDELEALIGDVAGAAAVADAADDDLSDPPTPPLDPPVEDPPVEDPPVEEPPVEEEPVKDPDGGE